MNFLTDQDVYASTVEFLKNLGHDVITASQLDMSQAADEELLQTAQAQSRIFVTRDRDYGALVFNQGANAGVIYLRLSPNTLAAVHSELERVLAIYDEYELLTSFVVVEPGRHRNRQRKSP